MQHTYFCYTGGKMITVGYVSKVINYLHNLGDNTCLTYKQLVREMVTLLMLLAGTSVDSLDAYLITSMFVTNDAITFMSVQLLKHSTPSHVNKPISYRAYPQNRNVCDVQAILCYLQHRPTMSNHSTILIT